MGGPRPPKYGSVRAEEEAADLAPWLISALCRPAEDSHQSCEEFLAAPLANSRLLSPFLKRTWEKIGEALQHE